MSIKSVPRWQYRKMLRHDVTLHKRSVTDIGGSEWEQEQESFVDYQIKAEIQYITTKDLMNVPSGLINVGDAWGYFLPSYFLKGRTVIVDSDDEITCEGVRLKVDRIEDHYQGNQLVWRRAYLRRLAGE